MSAGVEVRFDTKIGTNAPQAARGNAITVANPLMSPRPPDPAGVGRFLSPTAPVSSLMIPSTGLFPFPSGYTAYAGDCDANNPTLYDPDYFDTNSGFGNVLPGADQPGDRARAGAEHPRPQAPAEQHVRRLSPALTS